MHSQRRVRAVHRRPRTEEPRTVGAPVAQTALNLAFRHVEKRAWPPRTA
jgi:hypothetical protein